MLYIKDGYPEISEFVLCTVKKIYGNTTFVFLDEYEKEGVLTIAEIAPGRIRNLRDHVTENKKIICKVLRIDERSNRIDVSLRRVPIPVMKEKQEEIKKEEYSDRIYQDVAKEIGTTKDALFEKTYEPIFEDYETVFEALYDIMNDNSKIEMFTKLLSDDKKIFVKIINDRIKPEEVVLKQKFKLSSSESEGLDLVKSALKKVVDDVAYEKIKIIYIAAGEFEIRIHAEDMKTADKTYNKFRMLLEKEAKQNNMLCEIKEF